MQSEHVLRRCPSTGDKNLFPGRRGFTLVELLVVIAIIGILTPSSACGSSRPGSGPQSPVYEQSQANRPGAAQLSRQQPTVSAALRAVLPALA